MNSNYSISILDVGNNFGIFCDFLTINEAITVMFHYICFCFFKDLLKLLFFNQFRQFKHHYIARQNNENISGFSDFFQEPESSSESEEEATANDSARLVQD